MEIFLSFSNFRMPTLRKSELGWRNSEVWCAMKNLATNCGHLIRSNTVWCMDLCTFRYFVLFCARFFQGHPRQSMKRMIAFKESTAWEKQHLSLNYMARGTGGLENGGRVKKNFRRFDLWKKASLEKKPNKLGGALLSKVQSMEIKLCKF